MGLSSQITSDLKEAMLSGDVLKINTLKLLKSAIGYAELENGKKETGLQDEEIIHIIFKEAKKRSESIELYKKAGAIDRAAQEELEYDILKLYLPQQLSDEDLVNIINECLVDYPDLKSSDLGKIIGQVRVKVGNRADGSRIAKLVKERIK